MRCLRLITAIALSVVVNGPCAVLAAEAPAEIMPDGLTYEAWRSGQQHTVERLRADLGTLPKSAAAVVSFNKEDAERVAAHNKNAGSGAPYQVGVSKQIALDIDFGHCSADALTQRAASFASGMVRRTTTGGLTWALRLDAVHTGGVRVHLEDVVLPAGAALYIHNGEGDLRGPYTGTHTSLWTHSIGGDSVFLQLDFPDANPTGMHQIRFRVTEALVLDPDPQAFCGQNASCVEDGSCFDSTDWSNIETARKAVGQMLFIDDGFGYICTGGLLNDTDSSDFKPYFLTANHCLSTEQVADTLEVRFQFQTSTCGDACFWPIAPSTNGSDLLHTSSEDDHSLLLLDESPPAGSAFLGWTTDDIASANGTMLYRLSHPKQAPQAFSTHQVDTTAPTCLSLPRGRFIYSRNSVGATEGGSSGSPVMLANLQVVGQLFGACGSNLDDVCDAQNNASVDGAFRNYYENVCPFLDPANCAETPSCAATASLAGESGREDWLALAYLARDEVLPTTVYGDWMRHAYYRHSREVSYRLVSEPALRARALRLLRSLSPNLHRAAAGNPLELSWRQRLALVGFALAISRGASAELQADLRNFTSHVLTFR